MSATFQFQTRKAFRFEYHRGDCPICQGQRKDCRENMTTNTIHCRANITNPPGSWGFIGLDKYGFNMWRQDRGDFDYVPPTPLPRPTLNVPSIEERNRQFRQISKHSGLSIVHQEKLAQRQLSDGAIAQAYQNGLLWSWQPGENIPGVSSALPGVDKFGKLRRYRGMAVGIPDVHGRILGAQIKPDKGGGYIWLSSTQESDRIDGSGPQLPNGEIPMGLYAKPGIERGTTLDLAEGYLKPLIAADWFNLTVLGCAGGNWASSPEQLQEVLKELNIGTIILNPDGGAVANRSVCTAYQRLQVQLEQWGYTLKVRWWDQLHKHDGDIDEIDAETFAKAKLIDWSEFEFLALRHGGLERESQKDKWLRETQAIQDELNSLRVEPTVTAQSQYIDRQLITLPKKPGLILLEGPMGIGKTSVGLHELLNQHRQRYPEAFRGLFVPRNMLGYQSATVLGLTHHTHIPDGMPLQDVTMCLESWWKLLIEKFPHSPPLIIFDEVSQIFEQILYGQTCQDYHVAVLNRLQELLRYVKQQGGWVVLSEDGITNLEVDLVQEAGELELADYFKFEQESTHNPRSYKLFDAASGTWQDMMTRLRNGENLILASDSCQWLRETERKAQELGLDPRDIYILDSASVDEDWSREFTSNPDGFIEHYRPRVLGYSPTVQSGLSITDPTGHFDAMGIHLVHLQPRTAKQLPDRLRTDVPRFGYVKKVGANDTEQFSSSRPAAIIKDTYRKTEGIEKLISFAEYANSQDNGDDLLTVMETIKNSKDNPTTPYGFWLKHWARYRAREHWGKLHLRDHLTTLWQRRGHQVQLIEKSHNPELAQQRKAIREKLECEEAIAFSVMDTGEMTLQEAISTLTTLGATMDERRKAKKRLLQDKLPGCPLDDPDFVLKTTIKDQGRLLKATELLWLAQHPMAATLIDQWSWSTTLGRASARDEMVWLPSLSTRSAQAKLMSECPLKPFINGAIAQWDNNTPEAIAVHEWAYFHRNEFRRYLRLEIKQRRPENCPKDEQKNYHTTVQVVNKLLKKVGLIAEFCGWKGARPDCPIQGKVKRQRQYHIVNLADEDRETILKALTDKFLQRCESKAVDPPQEMVIASRGGVDTSTIRDHDLPDISDLDADSQVEFQWYWNAVGDEQGRSAVIQLLADYRAIKTG